MPNAGPKLLTVQYLRAIIRSHLSCPVSVDDRSGSHGTKMKRLLLIFPLIAIVAYTGAQAPVYATGSFYYDFEQALEPWVAGADPSVDYSLTRESPSACPSNGSYSANLAINGSIITRPGIWIITSYPAAGSTSVSVSWEARDVTVGHHCENPLSPCASQVYVGTSPPSGSGVFTNVGNITRVWTTYNYSTSVNATDKVYVAVGYKFPLGLGDGGLNDPYGKVAYDCISISVQSNTRPPP